MVKNMSQVTVAEIEDGRHRPRFPFGILPLLGSAQASTSLCADCRDNASLRSLKTLETQVTLSFRARRDPDCACCGFIQQLKLGEREHWWFIQRKDKTGRESLTCVHSAIISASEKAEENGAITVCIRSQYCGEAYCEWSVKTLSLAGPPDINFNNLRKMMMYCSEAHGQSCCAPSTSPVKGLKLINCKTRKIVSSVKGKRYATLSYVWGREEEKSDKPLDVSEKAQQTFEQLIEDALLVTMEMGLEYLWVDRYCIDQEDPEKHAQIRQMDLIYQQSDLTIAAAAGEGPGYGLPGMSRTRELTPCYLIGDVMLLRDGFSTGDAHITRMTRSSKWVSRAWTLQEALFPRRGLVFTDRGVSWCCAKIELGHGFETRAFRYSRLDILDHPATDQAFHSNPTAGSIGRNPWDIAARISEYSRRDLTYDSDALNAFTGILRAYENMNPPLYHFWGVPIFPSFYQDKGKLVKTERSTSDGFMRGLSWSLYKPSPRRPGFPSWSWAGWRGSVTCPWDWPDNDCWSDAAPVQVAVGMGNSRKLQWAELEQHSYFKDQSYELSPSVLHLEAWTIDVKICDIVLEEESWLGPKGTRRLCAEYFDKSGCKYLSCLQVEDARLEDPEVIEVVKSKSFISIILGSLSWKRTNMIAIVLEKRDRVEERFASFHIGEGRNGQPTTLRDRRRSLEELGIVRRSVSLG